MSNEVAKNVVKNALSGKKAKHGNTHAKKVVSKVLADKKLKSLM
jgi:hypothetical protein